MGFFKKVGRFFSGLFSGFFSSKASKELAVKLAVAELIQRTSVTPGDVQAAVHAAASYRGNVAAATPDTLVSVFGNQLPIPDLTPAERVVAGALLHVIHGQLVASKLGTGVDSEAFLEVMDWVAEAAAAAGATA